MNIKTYLYSLDHGVDHYINRYVRFIESCRGIYEPGAGVEHHHILPKALFPQFKDLSRHPLNGIYLPKKHHKIAHLLLAKAYPLSNMRASLHFFYIDAITGTRWFNDGEVNLRLPSYLGEGLNTGRLPNDAWSNRTYVSKDNENYSILISDLETYLSKGYQKKLIKENVISVTNGSRNTAIRQSKIDLFLSDNPDFRRGITVLSERRQRGNSKIYHKGSSECRVMPHEVDQFLNNGWLPGRSIDARESCSKADTQIFKGDFGKRVSKDEIQSFLDAGWSVGIPPKQSAHAKSVSSGRIRIHLGDLEKNILPSELNDYLSDGWSRGRCDRYHKSITAIKPEERGKSWEIRSPSGEVFKTRNLANFASAHGLSIKHLKRSSTDYPVTLKYDDSRSGAKLRRTVGWCILKCGPTNRK